MLSLSPPYFAHGLDLPAGFIRTKLVLVAVNGSSGRKLNVSPRITAMPSVYHHEAVGDACRADLSWTGGLLAWVTGDLLPRDQLRALHVALAAAPTWDVLRLEGGATLRGDFRGFEGPGDGVVELSRLCGRREAVERVDVTHNRSYVLGALGAVAGRTPSVCCTAWERPGWVEKKKKNSGGGAGGGW